MRDSNNDYGNDEQKYENINVGLREAWQIIGLFSAS
jgi:hypothetical protein